MGIASGSKLLEADARGHWVRLRTLINLRWVAVAGQSAAVMIATVAFGLAPPIVWCLAVIAAPAAVNVVAGAMHPATKRLSERDAMLSLLFDLAQVSALLGLTGGLTNPFALLMLAPVTIAASVLTLRSTLILASAAMVLTSVLLVYYRPLTFRDGGALRPPDLYLLGIWIAITVGIVFMAIYTRRIGLETARMSEALAAAQIALSREQRLTAIGALAAAAAHELGTPLGTIAVIARELARDLPKEGPLAEDAAILLAETGRCRDILARLAARPETDGGSPFSRLTLTALIDAAAAPHRRDTIQIAIAVRGEDGSEEPQVRRQPEIVHSLGTLIENAVQFAKSRVDVTAIWDRDSIELSVVDDGPGFSMAVLDRLGEPYISTRNAEGDHMGLGVFIASTLLARTGAKLEFSNRPEGGASVRMRWPRARIASPMMSREAAQ